MYLNQAASSMHLQNSNFFVAQNITDVHNLRLYMNSPLCYIHRFTILMKITSDGPWREIPAQKSVCSSVVEEL